MRAIETNSPIASLGLSRTNGETTSFVERKTRNVFLAFWTEGEGCLTTCHEHTERKND